MRGVRIDRLFYELGAEVSDFEKGMANAEKSASKFTSYVKKHPVAAVGALTAAFVALAAQAARMAAAIETNMRKVGAAMPAAAGQIKELTKEVVDLSKTTPRTAAELSAALVGVAKQTQSPIEAMTRLRAAVTAADASGSDLGVVIQGLDQVLDAFGISGAESEVVLAKLFATAKGKTSLDELFGVLERNGAELKRMGFGLDEAAVRMVKLLDAGVPARNIMTQFKAETKEIAGTTIDAAAAMREFGAAAVFTREGTENLWQILKNQFNAELISLGTQILPLVNKSLEVMVGFMMHLTGTLRDIRVDSAVHTINNLAKSLDKLSPERKAEEVKRLRDALEEIRKAGGFVLGSDKTQAELSRAFGGKSREELEAYISGLQALARSGAFTKEQLKGVGEAVNQLALELAKRPQRAPEPAGTSRPQGAPIPLIDEATKKRRAAMLDEARDAVAKLSGSLSAVLNRELEQIAERARELFGKELPAEIQTWMAALREQFHSSELLKGLEEDFQALIEESERGAEALRGGPGRGYAGAIAEASTKLRGLAGLVQDELNMTELTVAERERLKRLLEEIEKQLHKNAAAAGQSVKSAKDEAAERAKAISKATELGRKIDLAARGAIDLANAFGLMDDNTARVLDNVVQIASAIPAAMKGDFSSILGVAGGIAQLFRGFGRGKDPEWDAQVRETQRNAERIVEEQRRMAEEHAAQQRRNTEALMELTSRIGDLGNVNTSGQQFSAARTAAQRVVKNGFQPGLFGNTDWISTLGTVFIDLADLAQIAETLGLEFDSLNPTMEQFEQLLARLNAIELTEFAETFAGQLEALRAEFEVFDITDPIAQLQKLVGLFNDPNFGAPALAQALAGLDLTSPEGRAAAQRAIEALFERLRSGGFAGLEGELGGLTGEQFLQQLITISELLRGNAIAPTQLGETKQFGVERKITDIQADRLIALQTTGNVYLEGIQTAVEAVASYLRTILPPLVNLQPPALSALSAGPAGGISIGDVHVTVHAPTGDATAIRDAISDGLVEAISQKLETMTRQRAALRGNVLLS